MLSIRGLTRRYGDKTVLDDASFEVAPGRITGFVGANGAGKTTTMRIIMGVLSPTSGSVLWNESPLSVSRRRTFGYMPEERGLYPKMRVADQLVFFGRLHGIGKKDAADRGATLLTQLGLADHASGVLESLSLGNQQRVQIAAALMHSPTALVLDEPFSGLDPLAVESMVSVLRAEASSDVPILFSSHQLDLVERICDDVVVLAHGKVVATGPVETLRGGDRHRYRVRLANGSSASSLSAIAGLNLEQSNGSLAVVCPANGESPNEILKRIVAVEPVSEFVRDQRSLSEVFAEVVR